MALVPALAGCAVRGAGTEVATCAQALQALEGDARQVAAADAGEERRVVLRYRLPGPAEAEHRIVCGFAGDGSGELVAVATDRTGPIGAAALYFLKRFALDAAAVPAALGAVPYFLQQLANALTPAAIYALLATGYALIYGITGRINLAYGDFTTVGAMAALNGLLLGALGRVALLAWGLPAALLLALLAGAALGRALHALVLGPLWRRGSQALLIATIGLALVLSEGMRLATGSRQAWLPPFLDRQVVLLALADGSVGLSVGQLLLAPLALAAALAILRLVQRSAFGRSYRACADDLEAAALVGVDVDATLRRTCMLGGALAGLAGLVVAARYGMVAFGMGTLWGFKALAAAIVGGIGSLPGAAAGGLLIGLMEGLWSGYLPGDYREAALFALLALMLAVRPHGLFGSPAATENPALWRRGHVI
ncbi:MAG: branched-chain amino acid ABC transporter permease [Geminicoccaceae bacterium]